MNRWAVRILGLLLLLAFMLVFMQMYRTLVALQRGEGTTPTSTAAPRP
jgi:hypothetical protein